MRPAPRRGPGEETMQRIAIGIGVLVLALAASALARTAQTVGDQEAGKLPKCSGQLCQSVHCSADVLCARGTSVVTCAEVCGGH